jgi:eukaryotic-like serine/threonine-protein kinase
MSRFHNVFAELKRRHVYRVAVAYAIVAWVIIEVASVVVPELLLPAWITRALILVALLGFPLALVLAWAYDITPDGVQRTDPARPSDPLLPHRPLPAVLAAVVLLLAAGGGIGAWAWSARGANAILLGDALYAELHALSDRGDFATAFQLAAEAVRAGEQIPDSLALRFTDQLTVISDPPGAQVLALRHAPGAAAAAPGSRTNLGTTPLRGVSIPRGDYHLRIEAVGRAPAERMASSAAGRSILRGTAGAEVRLDVQLAPAGVLPAGMVFVPGGRYQVASRDLQSLSATLDDFFIDRYEVSNANYAEFVDAGGYERHDYWTDLADAAAGDAAALRARFVDRTGLPAPRGWSGQQYPPDAALLPVTDVTWYEAAAYCRFRQARLPTLFEWEKTARDGTIAVGAGILMPWGYVGPGDVTADRANLNGAGAAPVGSYPFGISAYGAYDMAGNAKEWLRNRSDSGRGVTGGSWADPIYVFAEIGSMDPATSSPAVGFRCARVAAAGRGSDQGDGTIRLAVHTPVYRPVDPGTFAQLLAHYRYDRRALDAVVEERLQTGAWVRERIRYNGPGDARVIAYLFTPRGGAPPYQTMVYVPNSAAFYGEDVARQAEDMLGPLVRAGRALFVVVMEGMTEREYPADYEMPATNSVAFRDQMVRRATELRHGLDYLDTRSDLSTGAYAYVGASWGAGSRLLFAAIDERFRAVILIGAGIDERVHPTLPEASNINFAAYMTAPTLLLNGRQDEEHPWLTRALPLWNLLPEPKELQLLDGIGHTPPAEHRIPLIRSFLDRHLGPPR